MEIWCEKLLALSFTFLPIFLFQKRLSKKNIKVKYNIVLQKIGKHMKNPQASIIIPITFYPYFQFFDNYDLGILDNWTHLNSSFQPRSDTRGDLYEFVIEGVLLTGVSLFGLIGNIVAIIVLSRPPMRGSFSTLLIGRIFLLYNDISSAWLCRKNQNKC